jgi:hypothetical protein
VRVVAELARHAIDTQAAEAGVPVQAATFPPRGQAVSEYLLDMESSVLRYKAHRPGLRGPDAGPKVLNHLIEVLAAASGCLEQYGWARK